MSAPFSTSSLANSLNLRVSTPAARNAVLGIDGAHFHGDQADAALGALGVIGNLPFGRRFVVVGVIDRHRRHDDTIFQVQRTQPVAFKK